MRHKYDVAGTVPTRVQRTPISGPALRIRDTLVPVALAVGGVFVLVGWTAAGYCTRRFGAWEYVTTEGWCGD